MLSLYPVRKGGKSALLFRPGMGSTGADDYMEIFVAIPSRMTNSIPSGKALSHPRCRFFEENKDIFAFACAILAIIHYTATTPTFGGHRC